MTGWRRTAAWTVAAIAGLVLAAALTTAASTLSNQRVGLSSEPLNAGGELAPTATATARPKPTRTPTPRPTRTATPKPTREPTAAPTAAPSDDNGGDDDGGGRGRGRGRGGDDD